MSAPEQGPMLEVADLAVRRGSGLVLSVSRLAVRPGETLAIIGPNGAGKSTLLQTMALLLPPTVGTIYVSGELATRSNALRLRRMMAMVFQEPLLLNCSVAENVAMGLGLRGRPRQDRQKAVASWLERFGIQALERRRAHTLSGGEAQRVSLARAFALAPRLLFLDEPFSALDAPTRASISVDLLSALKTAGTTTVFVTHDRDEALMFANRVAVLIDGQLRQVGPVERVFTAPMDTEVASFVGSDVVAAGEIVSTQDGLAQVQVEKVLVEVASDLEVGSQVMVCLRPEDVTLRKGSEPASDYVSSARNQIRGRVKAILPWGAQLRVLLDCPFPLNAAITRRSAMELGIVEGLMVLASFKATSAHLLPARKR